MPPERGGETSSLMPAGRFRPAPGIGGCFVALCWMVALSVFFLPLSNPDLFWHLSAARRILDAGALPKSDWLSWTMAGRTWFDFEWLCELIWYGVFQGGAMRGLLLLKGSLLAAAAVLLWKTLGLFDFSAEARGLCLIAWALALSPSNDIKADNFSLVLFSLEFWFLERRRLARLRRRATRSEPAGTDAGWTQGMLMIAGFALWANLHAGFIYGLILLGAYAAVELQRDRSRSLLKWTFGACLATLVNPYGIGVYRVLIEHWRALGDIQTYIKEWQEPGLDSPWLLPFWLIWILTFAVLCARYYKKRDVAWEHLTAICIFALSAQRYVRTTMYFSTIAVPLSALYLSGSRRDWFPIHSSPGAGEGKAMGPQGQKGRVMSRERERDLYLILAAAAPMLIFFGVKMAPALSWRRPFINWHIPDHMTDFFKTNRAALGSRRMLNPWQWGGYLGYELYPDYRVFVDGRYIFHPWLRPASEARKYPEAFQSFLNQNGIEVVLEKRPFQAARSRIALEGRSIEIERPFYLYYLPRRDWALVFWDDQGAVFARRSAMEKSWMDSHEFEIFRPDDFRAAELMIQQGHASRDRLEAEVERWIAEAEPRAEEAEGRRAWLRNLRAGKRDD